MKFTVAVTVAVAVAVAAAVLFDLILNTAHRELYRDTTATSPRRFSLLIAVRGTRSRSRSRCNVNTALLGMVCTINVSVVKELDFQVF